MLKKINNKTIFILLSIFLLFGYIFYIQQADQVKGVGITSFGGEIKTTVDCSGLAGCIPDSPDFAICLVPHCILGQNFVIQFFNNTVVQEKDGFDVMLDTILEPPEKANCYPQMCAQLSIPVGGTPDLCAIFCAANTAAQSSNESYVGQQVKVIKEAIQVANPGIAWVNNPMTIFPVCNATNPYPLMKYILGDAMGMGFYTVNPGNEIGDNCAGHYYPAGL